MIACRNADRNGIVNFGDLFAGFQQRGGPLFLLGLIVLGFTMLLGLLFAVFFGGSLMLSDSLGTPGGVDPEALGTGFLLGMLGFAALGLPLAMAQWFAPLLVALYDVPPWQAFKTSFRACLRNILPFLIYGVFALLMAIVASLPFMLGWLILAPVLTCSVYTAHKEIFQVGEPAAKPEDTLPGVRKF